MAAASASRLTAMLLLLAMLVAIPAGVLAAGVRGQSAHGASARGDADATSGELVADQRIVLHRNGGSGSPVLASVGIPFPPGVLTDAKLVRILDAQGREVPAAVKPMLTWHFKDGSIRAVRAQFRAPMTAEQETYYFAIGKPRVQEIAGWPYETGLIDGAHGQRVPMVLGTLTPAWLCASLIAGPQLPATANEAYAKYVSRQFEWASKLPVDDYSAWLFDRPSTLFKAYLRTGRLDYLQAADSSYRFYMNYIQRDGLPMSPFCGGGWTMGGKPCDTKYVYMEPILLAVALTGNDATHDATTVGKMVTLWENGGWSGRPGRYSNPSEFFTERQAGLGLLETVSAFELTGQQHYLGLINDRVGWLYEHQRNNPDGLGNDGSWRNSWQVHEGDTWNPATDVRGNSPWMSENIVDGLWHAWLVTGDKRIPEMITAYGRYLEKHGWVDPRLLASGHDWRFPCTGPDGLIAWYWSSAKASTKALSDIEDSEGWYSDAHNVELGLPVAAAYYFEQDPAQSAALKRRLEALGSSYNLECAAIGDTFRRFNWNNRGAGVVQWLIHQPPGSGAAGPNHLQAKR
ncbi:hypothetical protein ACXU4B_05515 [Dyella soli]|uniref:Uncharacterized protein n=1 Tax=Dyella soli TaxID=522319 RepID=A0A4R0YNE8_9GAMM|nr:hypothetical protein [Dyella soli]TCI10459.1 hypothetical protein EZM97_16405 [Dyella soli]